MRAATDIYQRSEVCAVYQPIVDLVHGDVVAVEALARWPRLLVTPDVAFDRARHEERVEELSLLCQQAAIDGLEHVELPADFTVFVNVEPGKSVADLRQRPGGPRLVAEITERALLADPAELMRTLRQLRDGGCGIALDDVGAVPDSLALMPFVEPDIIKLDISLVKGSPDADQARILTAVSAYAERSGATVLAEGVETAADYQRALTLGARLGQGWYFSRPGPLVGYPTPRQAIPFVAPRKPGVATPFELLELSRTRIGSKAMLLATSRHIEQQGHHLGTPPLVFGAFQEAERFTAGTAERYRDLALDCPLVVALGAGMPRGPAPGVRGGDLAPSDPLRGEWTVVVVGTHYTGALIAKDLGDDGPDLERRFQFAVTHHPETVLAAARCLLERIVPL